MHFIISLAELKQKVRELVETLRYKEMWQGEQLATLLGEPKPRSPQEYAMVSDDAAGDCPESQDREGATD